MNRDLQKAVNRVRNTFSKLILGNFLLKKAVEEVSYVFYGFGYKVFFDFGMTVYVKKIDESDDIKSIHIEFSEQDRKFLKEMKISV